MHERGRDTGIAGRARATPIRRLLAALLAVVQLVLAFTPLLDRDLGESAAAHVEPLGVQLHWSHDSAECAGCAWRTFGAAPESSRVLEPSAPRHAPPEPSRPAIAADHPHLASLHSRAPPPVT